MHLRPAMVVYSAHPGDFGLAIVPMAPAPSETLSSLHPQHGGFKAARCGLASSGYLIACEEIVVERQFAVKRIGRCPWQWRGQFAELSRQPLVPRASGQKPVPGAIGEILAREAAHSAARPVVADQGRSNPAD